MEEERVKSAFEIAMERISGLPELTPEEIAEQKEKEFRPVGRAIANKYLQGLDTEDELKMELNGYQGEKGKIVRDVLISSLCQSIQFEDISKADKALQGLFSLGAGEKISREGIQVEFLQVRRDLERKTQLEYKKYEEQFQGELEKSGIRGSAVKPNLAENDGWLQRLNGMRREHDPKLDIIRNRLMGGIK